MQFFPLKRGVKKLHGFTGNLLELIVFYSERIVTFPDYIYFFVLSSSETFVTY